MSALSARKIALLSGAAGPSLDLNLLSGLLDPRITFTRGAGSATYFDAAGTLQTAGTNVARFDNNPVTHAPLGLLREEARTNLATNSIDLSTWTLGATTRAAGAAVSPDGTTNAYSVMETAAAGVEHRIYLANTGAAASPCTISMFAKPNGRTWVALRTVSGNNVANFNLVGDGTVGTKGATNTASIQAVSNGWYRLSVGGANALNAGDFIILNLQTADGGTGISGQTYAGDVTKGVFAWGGMFEIGAFPTSYIPTTGAAATRAADVPTSVDTGWLKSGAGVAVLTDNTLAGVAANVSQVGDGSHANPVASLFTATPNGWYRRIRYWPRTLSASELASALR